jgi:hypothetical protein
MKPDLYLKTIFACVLLWVSLFLSVTFIVDPYGVSPINIEIRGVNAVKVRRLDIDRLIKPYEVWRYQPKTIFLGTSRIHQSIDPAVMDNSEYAMAYNASIPASSLSLNISHLRQYLDLNPNIETVFVELFIYNFLGQGQDQREKGLWEVVENAAKLFISRDAFWDSMHTVSYNVLDGAAQYQIMPGGHFYYPPGHDARGTFAGFAAGIWAMAPDGAESMKLHEPAIETVRQLQALADERGIKMVFLATPNHAYFDYFVESVGAWPVVNEWLLTVSREVTVLSFSQPNTLVYEPVSRNMKYWNDPFHFSLEMGRAMSESILNEAEGIPSNFMLRLTPELVPEHIASRRASIQTWADENPEYVTKLEEEHSKIAQ